MGVKLCVAVLKQTEKPIVEEFSRSEKHDKALA